MGRGLRHREQGHDGHRSSWRCGRCTRRRSGSAGCRAS